MYGAILGDMIGCPFEFDEETKSKEFPLFGKRSTYTDDTVMTVAIAEALLDAGPMAETEEIENLCKASMQKWGKKYNKVGYGGRFFDWLLQGEKAKPYNSWGNGSAMRVSPAGWLYDSVERTREVARATAVVSHNHPEGVKGAEATAAAIYLARTGNTKDEIKEYIESEFEYDLDRTIDEIRPQFQMYEDCQRTVPESVIGFLEGMDYEDTVRNVVSLGGDTDTTGAIAGSIAEAFFGIPENLILECNQRLEPDMMKVIENFYNEAKKKKGKVNG